MTWGNPQREVIVFAPCLFVVNAIAGGSGGGEEGYRAHNEEAVGR